METTAPITLVTGASSGIGRHAAICAAARGSRVIVTYSANPDGAAATVEAIEAAGGEALALQLDLDRSDTFAAFADTLGSEVEARWQRTTIDGLVNNAGFALAAPLTETTEEQFDALQRVLLRGPTSSPSGCCRCSPTAARSSTSPAARRCRTASTPATPPTGR